MFLYNFFFCNGLNISNDGNLIFGSRTFKLKIFVSFISGIELERFSLRLARLVCTKFDCDVSGVVVGIDEFSASSCKYLKLKLNLLLSGKILTTYRKLYIVYLKELGGLLLVLFFLPNNILSFSLGVNGRCVCNGLIAGTANVFSVICDSNKLNIKRISLANNK